jgi:hypothetical protein
MLFSPKIPLLFSMISIENKRDYALLRHNLVCFSKG